MKRTTFSLIMIAVLLNSCASSYTHIAPETIKFENNVTTEKVEFSYKYAVLADAGNTRYAGYEREKRIKVLAVKITNNSDRLLKVGESLNIFVNEKEIHAIDPQVASNDLQQGTMVYLLYLLLTPLRLNVGNGETVKSYPIGLGIGPGISLLNVAKASSANSDIKDDLIKKNIMGKEIKPGEAVTGLLILSQDGYDALSIRIRS